MGCIFWLLHDEHETRSVVRLIPRDLNEPSSLFVIVTGLPQKIQGLIMDKPIRLQDFVYRHPSDFPVAIIAQFVVCYSGLAVAFHAQDHLLETPPVG
jgi:hypothetical protein